MKCLGYVLLPSSLWSQSRAAPPCCSSVPTFCVTKALREIRETGVSSYLGQDADSLRFSVLLFTQTLRFVETGYVHVWVQSFHQWAEWYTIRFQYRSNHAQSIRRLTASLRERQSAPRRRPELQLHTFLQGSGFQGQPKAKTYRDQRSLKDRTKFAYFLELKTFIPLKRVLNSWVT